MKPLVTIGVPVRNGERFLSRALESHLSQTYSHFELVVSDNASSDRTAEILEAFARRDARIRVINQPEALGIFENFLSVLERARGEYFMWAAHDDQWTQEFIDALVSELELHPDAGVAMTAVELVTEDGGALRTIRFNRLDPNSSSHLQMLRSAASFEKLNYYFYALYRTSTLRLAMASLVDVPGFDRLFVCQLALGVRFRYVDRALHIRTIHNMPSDERLPEERFNALKRERWADVRVLYGLWRTLSRSRIIPLHRKLYLPYAMWRYAQLLLISRASVFARRYFSEAWRNRLRQRVL